MIENALRFVESLGLGSALPGTDEILAQFWASAFPVPIDICSSWDISKPILKNTNKRYEFSSNTSGLTMPGQFGQKAIHLPFRSSVQSDSRSENALGFAAETTVWARYQSLTDGPSLICPRFSMNAQSARRCPQTSPLFGYFVKGQTHIPHDSSER
jgi:hypothetical protein